MIYSTHIEVKEEIKHKPWPTLKPINSTEEWQSATFMSNLLGLYASSSSPPLAAF